MEPFAPITMAIVAATSLFSLFCFRAPNVLDKHVFDPVRILRHNEYDRLLMSGFVHANLGHLLVNMFTLYSFGTEVETVAGAGTLIAVYFSAIVGGNLLSLRLHRDQLYRALGASGGTCGVVFAAIFLAPGGSVYLFPVPVPIPPYLFAVLFILISFFGMRRQWGNIGHDAHLGGAVIGLAVATALHPSIVRESPALWCVVMALSIGLFWYLYRHPRPADGVRRR